MFIIAKIFHFIVKKKNTHFLSMDNIVVTYFLLFDSTTQVYYFHFFVKETFPYEIIPIYVFSLSLYIHMLTKRQQYTTIY